MENVEDEVNKNLIKIYNDKILKLNNEINDLNKTRKADINHANKLFTQSNDKLEELKIFQDKLNKYMGKNKFSFKMDNKLFRYFIYFIFIILFPLIILIIF